VPKTFLKKLFKHNLTDIDIGAAWIQGSGRKWEVSFPTYVVHSKTGKEKWENPFSFSLFPFTQSLPHFQGATVNFVVM